MRPIPMLSFARFVDARLDRKVQEVRDIRNRLYDDSPNAYFRTYHYATLLNVIRLTHWKTGNIEVFEDHLDNLVQKQKPQRRHNYRIVGQAYIEFWKERGAECFDSPRTDIQIGGLTVRVNPHVGMSDKTGSQLVKLWLNQKPPSWTTNAVLTYLMERAGAENEHWPDHAGILPVRLKQFVLPVRLPEPELLIASSATSFLEIWSELETRERSTWDELPW